MTEVVLAAQGLRLTRGDRVVLDGIDLSVRRGELVALRGPSGSGKTTILRTVAGLEPFDSGTIQIGDVRLEGGPRPDSRTLRRLRRSVGMVFQFHCLFEHLSALKNVWLAPVHAHGIPQSDAEGRAHELLTMLGVDGRASALPRELSGGEAQRVAIARALAVDPPVLLMDEPMASLDPSRRADLGAILQRLTASGRTLIVTSHDEAFARQFATRIVSLDHGTLTQSS